VGEVPLGDEEIIKRNQETSPLKEITIDGRNFALGMEVTVRDRLKPKAISSRFIPVQEKRPSRF